MQLEVEEKVIQEQSFSFSCLWCCFILLQEVSISKYIEFTLFIIFYQGADVNYLFTRKMFNWDESIFTRVSTIITGMGCVLFIYSIFICLVLQSLSSLILLPLLSYKLHVPDPVIGTMATFSSFAAILGIALSKTGTVYIFGKNFKLSFRSNN